MMQDHRATNKGSPVLPGKLDFHIRRTLVRANRTGDEDLGRFASKQKQGNIFKQPNNPEAATAGGPVLGGPPMLSEEFVRTSRVYRMLEEQIASIVSRHNQQMEELAETLQAKDREEEETLKQAHGLKVEVWELRNQLMELQGELARQEEDYSYLAGGEEEEKQSEPESEAMRTLGEGCASDWSGAENQR